MTRSRTSNTDKPTSGLHPGFTRAQATLDPERVERALTPHPETGRRVAVAEHGKRAWLVRSRSRDQWYQVTTEPILSCCCEDSYHRREVCIHIIAALLVQGDKEAWSIAREVV